MSKRESRKEVTRSWFNPQTNEVCNRETTSRIAMAWRCLTAKKRNNCEREESAMPLSCGLLHLESQFSESRSIAREEL